MELWDSPGPLGMRGIGILLEPSGCPTSQMCWAYHLLLKRALGNCLPPSWFFLLPSLVALACCIWTAGFMTYAQGNIVPCRKVTLGFTDRKGGNPFHATRPTSTPREEEKHFLCLQGTCRYGVAGLLELLVALDLMVGLLRSVSSLLWGEGRGRREQDYFEGH